MIRSIPVDAIGSSPTRRNNQRCVEAGFKDKSGNGKRAFRRDLSPRGLVRLGGLANSRTIAAIAWRRCHWNLAEVTQLRTEFECSACAMPLTAGDVGGSRRTRDHA
jgi:hypothetical protein